MCAKCGWKSSYNNLNFFLPPVVLFSKWGVGYKDTKSRESGRGRITSKKAGKVRTQG